MLITTKECFLEPEITFVLKMKKVSSPLWGDILQAVVVFVISIHAYANEKSEMVEVSMVALSGCIWLQAFVVTLETK